MDMKGIRRVNTIIMKNIDYNYFGIGFQDLGEKSRFIFTVNLDRLSLGLTPWAPRNKQGGRGLVQTPH